MVLSSFYYSPFVGCFLVTRISSNLCRTLTAPDTTEKICIISHAQSSLALPPNVFLTGTHWLLVASKGWLTFPSTNHCQGQLQVPQSFSVFVSAEKGPWLLSITEMVHCYVQSMGWSMQLKTHWP